MSCAVKSPSLLLDNQRTTQGPPRSRRPCPSSSDQVPQRPREPPAGWPCLASALASCCLQPHSAFGVSLSTPRTCLPDCSRSSALCRLCLHRPRPIVRSISLCAQRSSGSFELTQSYSALTAGWPGWSSRARAQRSPRSVLRLQHQHQLPLIRCWALNRQGLREARDWLCGPGW